MLNMTQRGNHYQLVWWLAWLEEANTAILCEGEVGTELNMTHRGRHWRLYDSKIQKGGKSLLYDVQYYSERQTLPPCMVFSVTERGKHCHLVWCSMWPKKANTTIFFEGEVGTERQTLPSRVVLNVTQRGNHCRLVWCWMRPRWKYAKR